MVYTNNVPQGNQTISATQPLIQANFGFLDTGIGIEHNFNAAGSGSDMYHLQASMPNKVADPIVLPAGTNGMYYVKGAIPKFYDGTTAAPLAWGDIASMVPFNGQKTITANTVSTISPAITGNIAGIIFMQRTSDNSLNTSSFFRNSGSGNTASSLAQQNGSIEVAWAGNNLAIFNSSSSTTYTVKYSGFYYTTV